MVDILVDIVQCDAVGNDFSVGGVKIGEKQDNQIQN